MCEWEDDDGREGRKADRWAEGLSPKQITFKILHESNKKINNVRPRYNHQRVYTTLNGLHSFYFPFI